VLWTFQVSGKQIVKNTKINGIDRPAGPGRADILMHLNWPGRAGPGRAGPGRVGPGRAGPGWVFSARAELYLEHHFHATEISIS